MGTILYTIDPNATTGFREATFEELIAGARHALAIRVRKGTVMASPNAARDYLTMRLAPRDHEVLTILFLDSRHRLIDCLEIFRGTIDGASVHPREVVKEALARNAAAVILSHNHPSGVAEPSLADELITQRLREALALIARNATQSLLRWGPDSTSVCWHSPELLHVECIRGKLPAHPRARSPDRRRWRCHQPRRARAGLRDFGPFFAAPESEVVR
jgi:DNA repair protein RadC